MTAPARRYRVVLVDDDIDQLALCRIALARRGAGALSIVTYSCPLTAWPALCSGEAPDCVVVDLHMPRMTGLELVARLRSQLQLDGTTIVMLTSSCVPEDAAAACAAGADAYLQKPSGDIGWTEVAQAVWHASAQRAVR